VYFSTSIFPSTIRYRENQGVVPFSLCPKALQRLSKISPTIRLKYSAHSKCEKSLRGVIKKCTTSSRNERRITRFPQEQMSSFSLLHSTVLIVL